jgi:hypothetical protein
MIQVMQVMIQMTMLVQAMMQAISDSDVHDRNHCTKVVTLVYIK